LIDVSQSHAYIESVLST